MSAFSELRKFCQIPRWSLNDGKYGFLSEKNTASSQSSQQRQKPSVAARASKENLNISLFCLILAPDCIFILFQLENYTVFLLLALFELSVSPVTLVAQIELISTVISAITLF